MGNYHDLDIINSTINLVEWAERAGAKLRKTGGTYRGNCPIHGGDNQNGFVIYDNEQRWTCFTGDCGSGDPLRFIMKYKGVGLLQAIEIATGGRIMTSDEIIRIQTEQANRAKAELQAQIERAQAVLKELNETEIWLRYHDQLRSSDDGKKWWKGRGIPEHWQNFWQLGYESDKRIWVGEEIRLPTATIPIWSSQWKCENVKHRLIGAPNNAGKYRYEYSDLPAPVYVCNPELEKPETVVLVEGEIKAMVTFLTLDQPYWQVIGMPGKSSPLERAKPYIQDAKKIIICCDPDTGKLNESIAKELGEERCGVLDTPMKIDDYILYNNLDQQLLLQLFYQARAIDMKIRRPTR